MKVERTYKVSKIWADTKQQTLLLHPKEKISSRWWIPRCTYVTFSLTEPNGGIYMETGPDEQVKAGDKFRFTMETV